MRGAAQDRSWPELRVDLVELGPKDLGLREEGKHVDVMLSLTIPTCPAGEYNGCGWRPRPSR